MIILQHTQKSNNYVDTLNLYNDICQLYLNRTGRKNQQCWLTILISSENIGPSFKEVFLKGISRKTSLSLVEPVSWNMKREGLKWKKAKEFKVKKREIKINYCSGFLTYFISLHLHNQILQMKKSKGFNSVQFSSSVVSDSLLPMDCSMPGFPVHHQLPELAQTHVKKNETRTLSNTIHKNKLTMD